MKLARPQHEQAAQSLRQAAASNEFIAPLWGLFPGMDAEDAYVVQRINTQQRVSSGCRIVGRKIGLT